MDVAVAAYFLQLVSDDCCLCDHAKCNVLENLFFPEVSFCVQVFYLDKLDRNPLQWGTFPRIKVWSYEEMRKASNEDRDTENGDFGVLGVRICLLLFLLRCDPNNVFCLRDLIINAF